MGKFMIGGRGPFPEALNVPINGKRYTIFSVLGVLSHAVAVLSLDSCDFALINPKALDVGIHYHGIGSYLISARVTTGGVTYSGSLTLTVQR